MKNKSIAKSKLYYPLTWCVIFALSGSLSNTFAAGIDCSRANTSSESIICGDAKLLKLDTQLSERYSKLANVKNINKVNLQKTQKEWLLVRDKCTNKTCMSDAYIGRVAKLNAELHSLMAYKIDKVDMLALDELRQSVEKNRSNDAEFPLEIALKAFEIKTGMTGFSNTSEGGDNEYHEAHFPTKRPEGVSQDEWAALVKSGIDGGGENGVASYTLLDIDGDGKRDLIIDSYLGGTGLFNYISATPRKGDVFAGHYVSPLADDASNNTEENGFLYSLNGRGSNQNATWVRLQGRVYAAYRNSNYGADDVFLLRPFHINENAPTLTVQYEYAFSIPKTQIDYENSSKPKETILDSKTYAALSKAMQLINRTQAIDSGARDTPICPLPTNVGEAERAEYFSFGPGHYSYEIVDDFPVWVDKICHIGQVVDWFGRYAETGLHAQLWLKLPNGGDTQEVYSIEAKRKAIKIKSSISQVVDSGGF